MYRKRYILKVEAVPEEMPEIPVRFYRTVAGREPVLDWLRELDKADRRVIGINLMRVQFGWPIGMPLVRSLGDGLWEVRSDLRSDRIARLLFCFQDGFLIVLHGFIKKTQKTPPGDLELARRRLREIAG
jgi:phage-related protein